MPTTPFLGIQQLTANQSQKELTINDAILQLEAASCGTLAVPFSTLTVTLSVSQFTHYFMFTAGTATADAVLQVPHEVNGNPSERLFGVRNTTGHGLTVRSDTGGGGVIVIPDGEARLLAIADNDVFIAAEPGVAVAFVGLSDVPHAYTGKAGQALVATVGEDGLEFIALVKSIDDLTDVDTTTSAPSSGQFLKWNGTNWVPSALPASISTFLGLTDTPSSYTGAANQFLRVNGAGTGVEFIAITQVPTDGTAGQVLTKGSGVTYAWADATGGSGVPSGGTTGQVLTKLSSTDGDADWEDPTGGSVPAGGTAGQVLTKLSGTDGDADWEDPTGAGVDIASYRFGSFFNDTPTVSKPVMVHPLTADITIPADFAGTQVYCDTPPSSDVVFTVDKIVSGTPTSIGTVTIDTSGVVTLATTGGVDISLNTGDRVEMVAPSDLFTIADTSWTFVATTATIGIAEAPIDGTPYARQDAGWVAASSGGGFDYLAPTHTAPVLADFTAYASTAIVNSSYDGYNGLVVVASKSSADFSNEEGLLLHQAPPAGGTWELTAQILPPMTWNSYLFGGITLFNSANNKAEVFGHNWFNGVSLRAAIATMTSVSSGSSTWGFNGDNSMSTGATMPAWFRLQYDGTNLVFLFSLDGQEWLTVRTETMASFMGAVTHVGLGFHLRLANSNPPPNKRRAAMTVYH